MTRKRKSNGSSAYGSNQSGEEVADDDDQNPQMSPAKDVNANCDCEKYKKELHNGVIMYSYNMATPSRSSRREIRRNSWCGVNEKGVNGGGGGEIRLFRERLMRTQSHPKTTAIKTFTRSQKLTLASLALVDFMSFCSMSIMAPFFPREAEEKGMSEAMSGFVFSFYALIMFITSPIFGKILPIVGAKFLFMSGIFVAGSCNLLFGVLEYIYNYDVFTTFCLMIRGLEALGASAYSTASYVYVVNSFPDNIGSVLGILETFVGLGMSAGPAIGGILYSIGGFGLPFYVLGIAMVLVMPVNLCLLPNDDEFKIQNKSGSLLNLIKVPAVLVTSLVIVIVSNVWAFLDPTLEPHLRQFNLSAQQIGLIFLLFSGLYGIFSPIWGRLADKVTRHWCMMVWGLFICSFGLLLLGPSPLLPFLESSLMLNLIGLSIIGISVALTLLPTFQGVLLSSIEEGGCSENLATYSIVAGIWSCMYSLGEVIGPSLGGILLKNYGFPVCSTVMAALTFIMAIITFIFFVVKENLKMRSTSDTIPSDDSNSVYNSSSYSENYDSDSNESRPLLRGSLTDKENTNTYYSSDYRAADSRLKNTDSINAYFIPKYSRQKSRDTSNCYNSCEHLDHSNVKWPFLDKSHSADGGSEDKTAPDVLRSPRAKRLTNLCINDNLKDFLEYNVEKINYYENSRREDENNSVLDRSQVTDVRGTINITLSGACEV